MNNLKISSSLICKLQLDIYINYNTNEKRAWFESKKLQGGEGEALKKSMLLWWLIIFNNGKILYFFFFAK